MRLKMSLNKSASSYRSLFTPTIELISLWIYIYIYIVGLGGFMSCRLGCKYLVYTLIHLNEDKFNQIKKRSSPHYNPKKNFQSEMRSCLQCNQDLLYTSWWFCLTLYFDQLPDKKLSAWLEIQFLIILANFILENG